MPLNFTVFIFAIIKVILFWWFYCYNFYHADFDRKLIGLSGFQKGPIFPTFGRVPTFPYFFSKMSHLFTLLSFTR